MSRVAIPIASVALAACVQFAGTALAYAGAHDALIAKHAADNGVPEQLVRRVIKIESGGRANAVHDGNYGLMQIRLGTARAMGYSGGAEGLLDPETNLTYAVKYLAGAYRAAGCDADRAVSYYRRGYYGAKRHNCEVAEAKEAVKSGAAKRKSDVSPAPANDVIKPRIVRAELISGSQPEPQPMPKLAKFEPVRLPPAVVRAVPLPLPKPAVLMAKATVETPAVVASEMATIEPVPLPNSQPGSVAKRSELAASPVVAMLEPATADSVPLPHIRPPLAQPSGLHALHSERKSAAEARRSHASKRAKSKKPEAKKADDATDVPGAVMSFLKKITTPGTETAQATGR